jgi:hypothetical protein
MALLIAAEILELTDGESKALHITGWELGEMDIQPRDGRPEKRIRVLRVKVPPAEKPAGPAYWDITGQTLIEQLLPYLHQPNYQRFTFTITKYGVAPKARFGVKIE